MPTVKSDTSIIVDKKTRDAIRKSAKKQGKTMKQVVKDAFTS